MAAILRVKQNGQWVEIPAIRGTTAYESAVAGGYTGTEEEFEELLSTLDTRLDTIESQQYHRYGVRWNKALKTMTRVYDAADITTTVTNFAHRGSINANYDNPFDSLYPWSQRRVVNTSLSKYAEYIGGSSIITTLEQCIERELSDDDFDWTSEDGCPVDVYTPEFWFKFIETEDYWELVIADGPLPGYVHAHETLGGRWFGKYNSDTVPVSITGIPSVNVAMSTLHTNLKTIDMTCGNIFTYTYDTILQYVEYACLNTQGNVGSGDSESYLQSSYKCTEASTGTTIKVPTAVSNAAVVGVQVDLGTTDGAYNTARTYVTAVASGQLTVAESVTVTTDTFVSLHGIINEVDSSDLGNASGYIGTSGKSHAYYRGRVSHGSRWQYILGAFRQTATDKFWLAKTEAQCDQYDALNTTEHLETEFALPTAGEHSAGGGDYVGGIAFLPSLPFLPLCTAGGGSSSAPFGDYCYWPTSATGNTVAIAGGNASYGSRAGRSSFIWRNAASASYWDCAVLPFYKTRA